jgi:hypothetical protein
MFAFLAPLLGIGGATAAAGTSLLTGMASSMVMGGLKSLLSPDPSPAAAAPAMPGMPSSPGIPETPAMDLSGVISNTPGLAEAIYGLTTPPPQMAPTGGINELPMSSTQIPPTMLGGADLRGMMGGGMGSSASAIYGQNAPRFADGGTIYDSLMMYDGGPTGGIMSAYPPGMDRGGMIRGPGSGVDDHIAGTIDNRQKVLLSDGEFVVPARVVSALGDGSSEAGAKVLHGMIDRVKSEAHEKLRTNGKSNLKKVLPA